VPSIRSILCGILVATAQSGVAAAVSEVDNDQQAMRELVKYMSTQSGKTITEQGTRPDKFAPVKGATNIPLKQAIKQLTPKGWKGYSTVADVNRTVSWATSPSWVAALEQTLTEVKCVATIDWAGKRILIADAPKEVQSVARSTTKAEPQEPWTAEAGDRAGEIIARWATKAGWQHSWEADELMVGGTVRLSGDFSAAVTLFIEALNRSAGGALKARFYELDNNRTVRVTASGAK
jgi:hypothetical protein